MSVPLLPLPLRSEAVRSEKETSPPSNGQYPTRELNTFSFARSVLNFVAPRTLKYQ
ncbi:MAG: hypothetical protein WAW00_03835 [Candidatus Moraniibacteriota bacterium]